MNATNASVNATNIDVLIVAPAPPPYGGMAIQAKLLQQLLQADGLSVAFFASNRRLPWLIRVLERIPALRTLARTLLIWLTLWRQIRRARVAHVLAASRVYFFAVVMPAVFYGRLAGTRVVLNYRGGDARVFFRKWRPLVRPIMRSATVITAPSAFLAEAVERSFQIPVATVRNILKTSVFRYRERSRFEPKVLITRHLEPMYDIATALKAFHGFQQSYPRASLIIAGTGSQKSYLEQLARQLGLNNVSFAGHVSHEHLNRLYDASDILLNSSRVDNFPGSLLEASGAGLAIVSTNAGGIPFMYSDEESALLSEPGDWKSLAANLKRVVADPPLASRLARGARSVARECEWTEVRRALYRAYGFDAADLERLKSLETVPAGSG